MAGLLHELEQSYLDAYQRLIEVRLPELTIKGKEHLPQVVVIDYVGSSKPHLRYVRPPHGRSSKGMADVESLVSSAIADLKQSGPLAINPANIAFVLKYVIEAEGTFEDFSKLSHQQSHEVDGSVFDMIMREEAERLKLGDKPATAFCLRNYLNQTQFDENEKESAFRVLAGEVALGMRGTPVIAITAGRVTQTTPVVVPFSALGTLRGAIVWFLNSDDISTHLPESLDDQNANSVRRLSAAELDVLLKSGSVWNTHGLIQTFEGLYSHAILDAFSAYFMKRLSKLTTMRPEDARDVARESLRCLFPCTRVRFDSDDDFIVEGSANILEYHLVSSDARKFLCASIIRWDLIYPFELGSTLFSPTVQGQKIYKYDSPYANLIERKLEDVAVTASRELSRQYGQYLGVFGHHIGNLMKESGLCQLYTKCKNGEHVTPEVVETVVDRILPVWGISQAVSLANKQDDSGWDDTLREWVHGRTLLMSNIGARLLEDFEAFTKYIFQFGHHEVPVLTWEIQTTTSGISTLSWEGANRSTQKLRSISILKEDGVLFSRTLSLTIGLYELLRNIRRYPASDQDCSTLENKLNKLSPSERCVSIKLSDYGGAINIDISQPFVLTPKNKLPQSKSLKNARALERRLLRGLAQTSQPEKIGDASVRGIVMCAHHWKFNYSDLIQQYRKAVDR